MSSQANVRQASSDIINSDSQATYQLELWYKLALGKLIVTIRSLKFALRFFTYRAIQHSTLDFTLYLYTISFS